MFTGIIEAVGRLRSQVTEDNGIRLCIQSTFASKLAPGQSVAVNGVCLTAENSLDDSFEAVAVPETLRKTNLGAMGSGAPLNLERALQLGARLDGHMVQGHVDVACPIVEVSEDDNERLYTLEIPAEFAQLVIRSGSIAIDGISLTIARLKNLELTVAIVPHTYEHTNAATWQVGTRCNIEFDVLGKYVARQLKPTPRV